ncbi:B-cell receptor-associated protein 31-like [Argonauta hians]
MGLQWTLIAYFLYFEVGVTTLLLVPFISCLLWMKLFKSQVISSISSYSYYYVRILMLILSAIFFHSIWQFHQYNAKIEKIDFTSTIWQQYHQKILKSQRNFYISGFTLFLWLVLNRLVKLISTEAQLQINIEENKRKVERTNIGKEGNSEKFAKILQDLREKLATAEQELHKTVREFKQTQIDFVVLKTDSESSKREYQRLLERYSGLQKENIGSNMKID